MGKSWLNQRHRLGWKKTLLSVVAIIMLALVGSSFISSYITMPGYSISVNNFCFGRFSVGFHRAQFTGFKVYNIPFEIKPDGVYVYYDRAAILDFTVREGVIPRHPITYYPLVEIPLPEPGHYWILITYLVNGKPDSFEWLVYSTPVETHYGALHRYGVLIVYFRPWGWRYEKTDKYGKTWIVSSVYFHVYFLSKRSREVAAEELRLYRDGVLVRTWELRPTHLAVYRRSIGDKPPIGLHEYWAEVRYSDGTVVRSQKVEVYVYGFRDVIKRIGALPELPEPREPIRTPIKTPIRTPPQERERYVRAFEEAKEAEDIITIPEEDREVVILNEDSALPLPRTLFEKFIDWLRQLWQSFVDWLTGLLG